MGAMIGHGARETDNSPCGVVGQTRGRHVGGREERQRKRDDDSGQCPEQGDVECLQRRPNGRRKFREIRRHGAPNEIGHAKDAGHEVLRPRLNHNERLNDDGEPQQSESEMGRLYERAPPRRRAESAIDLDACDIETHAASGR
jgi:hypothetical protein